MKWSPTVFGMLFTLSHRTVPRNRFWINSVPPIWMVRSCSYPLNQSHWQVQSRASWDISGTNVVRLVRAKQPVKRKSSLDTLIEVVQKELLRVNEQANSKSPSPSPPRLTHVRSLPNSRQLNRTGSHRSVMQSVLPSSHPASLTSQSVHSLKITRKDLSHNTGHFKRSLSYRQRHRSLNAHDDADPMDHDGIEQRSWNDFVDDGHSESETIEDVVRDTVDRLVAITLLNTAPFVVNMLTAVPGSATNTDSKMSTNSFGTHVSSPLSNSRSFEIVPISLFSLRIRLP